MKKIILCASALVLCSQAFSQTVTAATETVTSTTDQHFSAIEQLSGFIPQPYRAYVLLALGILPVLGRIYTAVKNGGGLPSMWKSVVLGVSRPKDKE